MNRAGTVVRSAQGLAVVRSPDDTVPTVGAAVVDEGLSEVGEVVTVFGPVGRPYAAVRPAEGVRPARLVGDPVYAREG